MAGARGNVVHLGRGLGRAAAGWGPALGRRGVRGAAAVRMALKTGIVGLPNVGKSTLFNSMVEGGKAEAANFPFCTIEPNTGIVPVPDERLDVLSRISASKKKVYTTFEFVDIAGLVKGASEGEGLGNKFLSNIRECDSIVQVVRCFEDDNVVHVDGRVDPVADAETINLELALSDLAQVDRRLEKLKKEGRNPKAKAAAEAETAALGKVYAALEEGLPARSVDLSDEERELVRGLQLLTIKPLIYAANVAEDDLLDLGASNAHVQAVQAKAAAEGSKVIVISAQLESELIDLDEEERAAFLVEVGVEDSGLKNLVTSTYAQLGLQTYFTTGEQETRAWTIRAGTLAPGAAGVIHGDFERGFIKASTVSYDDFVEVNGWSGAKESGKMRLEGKTYEVKEGDVMEFAFNV